MREGVKDDCTLLVFPTSISGVRRLGKWLSVLAAVLWLPMTLHCQLESIPGLEFLACASEGHNPKGDCSDDGCCAVEKSQYKSEQARLMIPSPDLLPLPLAPVLDVANLFPLEASLGILTAAPPELHQTWHFVSRTALPVRAPSIAS